MPHLFRWVVGSPVETSTDGQRLRFLVVNRDGVFQRRIRDIENEQTHESLLCRIRGDVQYDSAWPCACGCTRFRAGVLTWSAKGGSLTPGTRLCIDCEHERGELRHLTRVESLLRDVQEALRAEHQIFYYGRWRGAPGRLRGYQL